MALFRLLYVKNTASLKRLSQFPHEKHRTLHPCNLPSYETTWPLPWLSLDFRKDCYLARTAVPCFRHEAASSATMQTYLNNTDNYRPFGGINSP